MNRVVQRKKFLWKKIKMSNHELNKKLTAEKMRISL